MTRPITPISHAFSALGATIVPSLMMAGVAAASATPVTDAAAAPIALSRSPDCRAVTNRPGVCRMATGTVTAPCTKIEQ